MTAPITPEAVQAAARAHTPQFANMDETIQKYALEQMRAALTAAAPFLTGCKVKELEWSKGVVDIAQPHPGMKYVACSTTPKGSWAFWLNDAPETRAVFASEEAAKAAAQADYDARIRSAIEVSALEPSTRAQLTVKDLPKAEAEFTAYFVKNYPGPDTLIHKPEWHAPKIFRAALHAIRSALEPSPRAQALEEAAQWHDGEASRKRAVAVKSKRLEAQIATHEVSAAVIRALSSQPVAEATINYKEGDRVVLIKDGRSTTGAVGKLATITAWTDGKILYNGDYLLKIDPPYDYETLSVNLKYTRATPDCFMRVADIGAAREIPATRQTGGSDADA